MGLDTASEPGVSTSKHVLVRSGEYLRDGDHQAGLGSIEMSIGMSLISASGKKAHQLKI